MLQTFPSISEQTNKAMSIFRATFSANPADIRTIFVPYRICPLGAHVDHQGGRSLARTINTGTVLVYAPCPDPVMSIASPHYSGVFTSGINDPVIQNHWGRYAQAAALSLGETYSLSNGINAVSLGTLLGAGLSSSASVGLAYLQAFAGANNLSLDNSTMLELDFRLEQKYLELDNGILDPAAILYSNDSAFVHIDSRKRRMQLVPDPPDTKNVGWLLIYSGVRRDLTLGTGFNTRVAECRATAKWLSDSAKILSDVSPDMFAQRKFEMPENLRLRAMHYFGETARVAEGKIAWQNGDFARFGVLMNASCSSSIHNYQSGHETIIALHRIVRDTYGVYGSRFCGGGYGGCVLGLVNRAEANSAAAEIMEQYRALFPEFGDEAAAYWVEFEEIVR